MLTPLTKAQAVFRRHAGLLRTSQALAAGIHPRTLYALRDSGQIEALGRGLYRLLNEAKRSARPFNELLQCFAMERFLYLAPQPSKR